MNQFQPNQSLHSWKKFFRKCFAFYKLNDPCILFYLILFTFHTKKKKFKEIKIKCDLRGTTQIQNLDYFP